MCHEAANDYGLNHIQRPLKVKSHYSPFFDFLKPRSKRELENEEKKADIERKRAETEVMRTMANDEQTENEGQSTLLIVGVVAAVAIVGAVLMFRKKETPVNKTGSEQAIAELIV